MLHTLNTVRLGDSDERSELPGDGVIWTHDFDWKQFMEDHATYPARSAFMFPHVRYLEKTLAEQIFPPGKIVSVKKPGGSGATFNAKVELVVEDEVLVEAQDDQHLEQIPLDWVYLTESDLQAAYKGYSTSLYYNP